MVWRSEFVAKITCKITNPEINDLSYLRKGRWKDPWWSSDLSCRGTWWTWRWIWRSILILRLLGRSLHLLVVLAMRELFSSNLYQRSMCLQSPSIMDIRSYCKDEPKTHYGMKADVLWIHRKSMSIFHASLQIKEWIAWCKSPKINHL